MDFELLNFKVALIFHVALNQRLRSRWMNRNLVRSLRALKVINHDRTPHHLSLRRTLYLVPTSLEGIRLI